MMSHEIIIHLNYKQRTTHINTIIQSSAYISIFIIAEKKINFFKHGRITTFHKVHKLFGHIKSLKTIRYIVAFTARTAHQKYFLNLILY